MATTEATHDSGHGRTAKMNPYENPDGEIVPFRGTDFHLARQFETWLENRDEDVEMYQAWRAGELFVQWEGEKLNLRRIKRFVDKTRYELVNYMPSGTPSIVLRHENE